jgi:lipoprotein-releasing system permease protein
MSRLPFELLLALRYLRPKRTFVSVITLLSIVGVTLGVAVLIIVVSVMNGFNQQTRERILGFLAHLKVYGAGGPLLNRSELEARIRAHGDVTGVAPFVLGQVLIETEPREGVPAQVSGPWLRGLDPASEGQVSILPRSIVEGEFDLRGNGLLVGSELAAALRLHAGDRVSVYSTANLQRMKASRQTGREEAIVPDEYTVRGVFDVGYYEYNAGFIASSLANAQDLYELGDAIHGLIVKLRDPFAAERVAREIEGQLGRGFVVRTWMEENANLLGAVMVEKNLMIFLLFFIMIVAAFGITAVMITFVVQKTREIGVLKAVGATDFQIMCVFLGQTVPVGVMGVLCGYGLGCLALAYRNEFLFFLRKLTGLELFPAAIYNFNQLPSLMVAADVVVICGGSLLICVLAGVLPAWRAGRLDPVEALRHE